MDSYKRMAELYDELIYQDIDYNKIYEFIMKLFFKYGGEKENYLDLAGGTGNVSIKVQEDFKNTFLVDLSEDMLIQAEGKFRENRKKAKIICQDMCKLNLNKKFNLITCVLDSSNYILDKEDLKDYFKGVYNHLEDEGVFIFDINSYYKLSEILGNNTYTYNSDDVFYVWENIFEDEIVEMNLTFFIKENDKYQKFDEVHEERAYKDSYIDFILEYVGFQILQKTDGYSSQQINDKTERIVYVVKKN